MISDPYKAYVNNGVVGSSPVELVIALYETAILRTQEAKACLESGDVWGRARAISKANNILTQLIVSLDPGVGSEMGLKLDRLYHYMQRRLQEAHLKKSAAPLIEVEKLLTVLLHAWVKVGEAERRTLADNQDQTENCRESAVSPYNGYEPDTEPSERLAVSA